MGWGSGQATFRLPGSTFLKMVCLTGNFVFPSRQVLSASLSSEIYLCPDVLGIYNQRICVCVINVWFLLFIRV